MDDTDFMNMALKLAEGGRGYTSPNPMVGAVIVKDGRVRGKGWHRAVGEAHAEVNAIEDAGPGAAGSVLYVTLEPCNHTGRTPPCTEKILSAGIRRVVAAMEDPNPDVAGGGCETLRRHGVQVTVGVCEKEAKRQNEVFIKYVTTRRPFVVVKCAATLDGRLATRTGDSKWVTGEASREYVHGLRHALDGILVGIDTIQKDDPRLTTRLEGGKGADPVRIVLDTRLSIRPEARVLNLDSSSETFIICGSSAPGERKKPLAKKGVRIFEAPLSEGKISLAPLMVRLGELGVTGLLIEGGGRVIGSAFREGIVDKVCLFFAPKILGGDDGIPICRGPGPALMSDSLPVRDLRVHRFEDDVMIEGYVGPGRAAGSSG